MQTHAVQAHTLVSRPVRILYKVYLRYTHIIVKSPSARSCGLPAISVFVASSCACLYILVCNANMQNYHSMSWINNLLIGFFCSQQKVRNKNRWGDWCGKTKNIDWNGLRNAESTLNWCARTLTFANAKCSWRQQSYDLIMLIECEIYLPNTTASIPIDFINKKKNKTERKRERKKSSLSGSFTS